MNEHFEELEAELAALKLEQPSPRLRQRIADELQNKAKPSASGSLPLTRRTPAHQMRSLAIAGALAVCALAAFFLRHSNSLRQADRPSLARPNAELPQPLIATAFDDARPSVWTYQRALSRSPDELEALLDKHASLASPAGPAPNHLLFRTDRNLLLQGEL